MSLNVQDGVMIMSGPCGVEDVDALVEYLAGTPNPSVDIGAATALHTAHWQALMAFMPTIIGTPISSPATDAIFRAVSHHIDEARAS